MTDNTKNRAFSVRWTVCTGPDRSHLTDVRIFDRLHDARVAYEDARLPRQLWRHTWLHPYGTGGDKRLLREDFQ